VNSRSVSLVVSMLLSALGSRNLAAQCRVSSDTASLYVNRLRVAYANMDTSYVKTQGDPVAAPSDISLVTSSNTCKSGVNAYNKTHGLNGPSGIKSAYVIALGNRGYIVINPSQTSGEYTMMFIYTSQWVFKKAVGG
jgi:hypothetical protein